MTYYEEYSHITRAFESLSFKEFEIEARRLHPSLNAMVRHLRASLEVTQDALLIGAHAAYAWMPTMLSIDKGLKAESRDYEEQLQIRLDKATTALNKLRRINNLPQEELIPDDWKTWMQQLRCVVNDSMVGTSKVLHAANPTMFPIWDSRIRRALKQGDSQIPHDKQLAAYVRYVEAMHRCLTQNKDEVDQWATRYRRATSSEADASLRALELALWIKGKK